MQRELEIDGVSVWINDLQEFGDQPFPDAKKRLSLSEQNFADAIEPIVRICQAIGGKMKTLAPDETEMTVQLTMGLEGDRLVFGLVKTNAEAMISLKFVWKKDSC